MPRTPGSPGSAGRVLRAYCVPGCLCNGGSASPKGAAPTRAPTAPTRQGVALGAPRSENQGRKLITSKACAQARLGGFGALAQGLLNSPREGGPLWLPVST